MAYALDRMQQQLGFVESPMTMKITWALIVLSCAAATIAVLVEVSKNVNA